MISAPLQLSFADRVFMGGRRKAGHDGRIEEVGR
jgi:hypothetical protein